MNKLICITVALLLFFLPMSGQKSQKETAAIFGNPAGQSQDFSAIDAYVLNLKYNKRTSIQELASEITKTAESRIEKARAIFIWLANNIAYDTNYKITTQEDALKQGKGVCQAYSGLFKDLCDLSGLECVIIAGDSKQYYYVNPSDLDKGGHAWNAVKLEDRWILADATWGAGYVNNKQFTRRLSTEWFDPSPSIYIFSHLPKEIQWQLLEQPISRETFLALPPLYPNLCLWGLNADALRIFFLKDKHATFPEVFSPKVTCTITDMPVNKVLKKGTSYDFEFILPENSEIAIISNNKDWQHFQKDGNRHSCSFTPGKTGTAILAIKQDQKEFGGVFKYTVK